MKDVIVKRCEGAGRVATTTDLDVVTGALSYTGRYIARRLLDEGRSVRTLTFHPDRADPLRSRVEIARYRFDDPVELARSLEGATTLYNTYWVRFPHGRIRYGDAVESSRALFHAARAAGVERIVHVSITNPSLDSQRQYFRGKALVEHALAEVGLPFAIVRPAVVFGDEDVLVNNIAWLLRRFPVFAVAGHGDYRLRPVHVDDVARLCVEAGTRRDDVVVDAVGPETFTFRETVALIRDAIGSRSRILGVPAFVIPPLSRLLGLLVRDVLLTRDELLGMMENLVVTDGPATGTQLFSEWVATHAKTLGVRYASELERHFAAPSAAPFPG